MKITTPTGYTKTGKAGVAALLAGSSLWGLFWIPLHYLEIQGLSPLWTLVLVMIAALFPALVLTIRSHELADLALFDTWLTGFILGLATTLYFIALAYTDVIRVIFLFYLLPLWTTLSARLIYAEPIRAARLLVMLIALSGLWLLLGGDTGVPMPESVGDWCAIASGMCWGISLSLLHGRTRGGACSRTLVAIGSAVALSLLAALFIHNGQSTLLSALQNSSASARPFFIQYQSIIIATVFGLCALYPSMLAQVWGARHVSAPTAALLTMSEIVVAILSAAILVGTDLAPLALLGGAIIILAVCMDIALQFIGQQPTDNATGQP